MAIPGKKKRVPKDKLPQVMKVHERVPPATRYAGYPSDDGVMNKYDSKMEQRVHLALMEFQKEGLQANRIASHTRPYVASVTLTLNYNPDFVLTLPSGRKLWVECKGHLKDVDKMKLQNLPPFLKEGTLIMVFSKATRIMPHRKSMTYSEWASKYGMLCCSEDELDLLIAELIKKDIEEHELQS